MKTIVIKTIPNEEQRYPTVGDYFDGRLEDLGGGDCRHFRISDMQNADYEFLVMVHELIENHFVQKAGISDQAIDDFDKAFEETREQVGDEIEMGDPGDDENAPYHKQHVLASRIERFLADALEIDWETYNATVMSL